MNSTFTTILRFLLAIGLLLFGLNKFVGFMPMPEMPVDADNFMNSLEASGYIFYLVGALEIVVALLLLLNKWVPFALLLLAPISVNIVLFHLFLDVSDILGALIIATLNIILIYKHWKAYKPLFRK